MDAPDRGDAKPFVERHLKRDDISRIDRLYRAALEAVPNPAAVRPDEPSFFEAIFDDGGEILGLEDAEASGDLMAYGVLRPELAREHDRVALDGLVNEDVPLWVLDGSAVRPTHWRMGLQRSVTERRIAQLERKGIAHAVAKISPGNLPSMRNLLRCGFVIVGGIQKPYGWRYIHYRPVAAPVAVPKEEGEWIRAADLDEAAMRHARGEAAVECALGLQGVPMLKFVSIPGLRR